MVRLAWMTDLHLNFLEPIQIDHWLTDVRKARAHAVVITGDIGEASTFEDYLIRMAGRLGVPLFFVLGNHDYYHGSIAQVRETAEMIENEYACLNWLPAHGVVKLNEETALVGHGGWGDAQYGDFLNSSVMLNDYLIIDDLNGLAPVNLQKKLKSLGKDAVETLAPQLEEALTDYNHVYVATHVPPFQESCWYDDKTPPDDDDYLPHFACKAVGDLLLDMTDTYPTKLITVLCGHTHGRGETQMRPNLQVITEGATYGEPTIARVFDI
ncbi:MAG: metallophosphoesterase [Chloroflexota bacterium]